MKYQEYNTEKFQKWIDEQNDKNPIDKNTRFYKIATDFEKEVKLWRSIYLRIVVVLLVIEVIVIFCAISYSW